MSKIEPPPLKVPVTTDQDPIARYISETYRHDELAGLTPGPALSSLLTLQLQVSQLANLGHLPARGGHYELAVSAATETSRLSPEEQFRKQVYETWIPKWDEEIDGVPPRDWFANAEHDGAVELKKYNPAELRQLRDTDKILWKEECHFEQVLAKIRTPIDPARSFAGRGEGPVIFVRDEERGLVIVVNGNHRTGAVMMEKYNPSDSPLYVVEFSSVEAFEKFCGVRPSDRGYMNIQVEQGGRRHL